MPKKAIAQNKEKNGYVKNSSPHTRSSGYFISFLTFLSNFLI